MISSTYRSNVEKPIFLINKELLDFD